jgi:hypothetical protein
MTTYFSEVLLLTKSEYPDELECYIEWYLDILGFSHVVVFDNESSIDVPKIVSKYPKIKVEYFSIFGWPNQYKLYTEYLKNTKAQWSIALDDDEFLYISDKYNNNIESYITNLDQKYKCNKYYIPWVNLFSANYLLDHRDLYFNTHTYYSYEALHCIANYWVQGNCFGKCLINNQYNYEYNNFLKHIPKCLNGNNKTVLTTTGQYIQNYLIRPDSNTVNSDCYIAHYQFKNKKDWIKKCNWVLADFPISLGRKYENVYDKLYQYTNFFRPLSVIQNKWNIHSKGIC